MHCDRVRPTVAVARRSRHTHCAACMAPLLPRWARVPRCGRGWPGATRPIAPLTRARRPKAKLARGVGIGCVG